MIDLNKAEATIFSSSTEDYTGLYEAIWELNTLYPNESIGEKYKAAEAIIRKLLSRNLINLFKRKDQETYIEIKSHDLEKVLSNPVSWYPDNAGICIVFTATEEGNAKYSGK